ncbi:MAG: flagellar motor protein MotB [Pseudomonadota bacterium]
MAKKGGDDGGNPGVWKLVYADFVTAMMAFFLILWLANTASEAERDLLADYFNPISVSRQQSGSDGAAAGQTNAKEGAQSSDKADSNDPLTMGRTTKSGGPSDLVDSSVGEGNSGADDGLKALEEKLQVAFRQQVDPLGLNDVVYIERREDAVYIQIHDDEAFAMFSAGSAQMTPRARELFSNLGEILRSIPNVIRIMGHTDGSPFSGNAGSRGNWELSADRANSARRVMETAGLQTDRVEAVEGRATREPLVPSRPNDPKNRRITISVHSEVAASGDLLFSTAP